MTDSERQQILKMIEDGKITAEQGLTLMQALGDDPQDDGLAEVPADETIPSFITESGGEAESKKTTDPEFDRKVNRFRSLWVIPLWIGVAITVAGAYWMYSALQSTGFGFWFSCAWLPFLLGVLVTALAFSSRTSRWIYINVKQKPGESLQRIVIAFPLSLVSWGINFVKGAVPQSERGAAVDVMKAVFDSTKSDEPLMVDVREDDGEHVQVYIG
ncbi:MAG: hypothetical protein NT121_10490 [Chloroflexi bacterium]|nr:hypothetical protein [Chloroflexota bacterium]